MKKLLYPASVASVVFVLVAGGLALAAQDWSTLKVPGGLAFAEFNGYRTWQVVAPSQTDTSLKVIMANEVMLKAFKAGLPAKGKTFPEGSRVVKLEWEAVKNPVSPYFVRVPGQLKSIAFIVKDSKRFPKTHGWAYADFLVDPASKTLKPNGTGAECGYACHTTVAAQDYIFTAYPQR